VLEEGEDVQRWTIWNEVGRLRALAGDPEAAVDALVESISGDFLRPEAYEAALAREECQVPEALRGWWKHLLRLLAGSDYPEGVGLPPRETFADEELDALHPGGVGWLEGVRTNITVPEAPERQDIVRGLEQLGQEDHPDVWRLEAEMCTRLGFEEPPPTYLFRGAGAWGVSAWPLSPPVVLLGFGHLGEDDRHLDADALGFLFAVELTHLRCDHPLLAFDKDLVGTSRSVYSTFGKYAGTAETVVDVLTLLPGIDQVAKLQSLIKLSRKVFKARGAVDKVSGVGGWVGGWFGKKGDDDAPSLAREGLRGAALQFRLQADRVALLATGNARSAVDAILRSSSRSLPLADRVREEGLAAVLAEAPEDPEHSLAPDEALRITMLLEFAAEHRPSRPEEG
jgi:hypothetical protein